MLRGYSTLVYLFLYAPILLVVVFAFNAGSHATSFECCGVSWFGKVTDNPFMMEALYNSLRIALTSAVIATVFGTMAVLALEDVKGPLRATFDGLTYSAIIIPGIVIGIASLSAMKTLFDMANPVIEAIWPGVFGEAPRLQMGFWTVVASHSLFTMALVMVIVRTRLETMDKRLIEASFDLYASPRQTLLRVTLPYLAPGILAAFLLAFTFSFDDFIIAFFVAGSETTLPIYIFSSIRRGVTPEVNAISTLIICVSLALLFSARLLETRGLNRSKRNA
ncbi:ABC transporter permease [Shewanella khirikhana]|uniref:ABC transporter permease n=1 Tax=Shewanella khirikhana TaxID=1965282 RepID=UPI0030D3B490